MVPQGMACKNWDGNKGYWEQISGAAAAKALLSAGKGQTTGGDLSITTSKIFDTNNLVRRLLFMVWATQCNADLSAPDHGCSQLSSERMATAYVISDVVRSPTARVQLKVLPYGIVYQPPGDQSTSTVTMSDLYNTTLTLTNSSGTTNNGTADDSGQISASISLGYKSGDSGDSATGGGGQNWDNSTESSFGTTTTDVKTKQATTSFSMGTTLGPINTLIPGSGETCPSETSCSPLIANPSAYLQEPFCRTSFCC
jgi:hypothetical protein